MDAREKVLNEIRIYNRWKGLTSESRVAIKKACLEDYRLQYTTCSKLDWTDIPVDDIANDLEFDSTVRFQVVPNYIPFTPKEMVDHLGKEVVCGTCIAGVASIQKNNVTLGWHSGIDGIKFTNVTYSDLQLYYKFTDGSPCGVKTS